MFNKFNQSKTPKQLFFTALQTGDFNQALLLLEKHQLNPNLSGGILKASPLYYIACSSTLDPDIFRAFLGKGADPYLKNSTDAGSVSVLEQLVDMGYFYYTGHQMPINSKLAENFFKSVELLASKGLTFEQEALVSHLQHRGNLFYNPKPGYRDYTEFDKHIFDALERGKNIFEKIQKESKIRKLESLYPV